MMYFFKSIILFVIIFNLVTAHDPLNFFRFKKNAKSAHISPELIRELEDFEDLIPQATIDGIIAKHLLLDGNFRTALIYLRSQEFTQLQKQLLNIPEIIDVLEFLHLTAENATTRHVKATKMPTKNTRVMALLDEFSDGTGVESYKRIVKMTTNMGSIITKPQTVVTFDNAKEEETVNKLKVPKRPLKQFYIKAKNNKIVGLDGDDIDDDDDDDDDETVNANSIAFNEQEPLVHIVLLEDLEVKAKVSDKGQQHNHHHHHHENKHQRHNSYYHYRSLGTFISFVEEVLQHLPNSSYQNMIRDKCNMNTKFAQFYHALRSPALKPFIEQIKQKPNIQKIIATLNSHDVDVNALEPIVFQVISWGPNI